MDNLTHTLTGLALAETGLRRRSRWAVAALVIGANLPDVDGLIYLRGTGADALAFRRGWTHGILAMAVWPLVLTGALLLLDRWRPRRDPGRPLVPRQLLLVAAIGIWSHPLLDWFNVYGVRLLMPFSGHWFQADALFIIDPWVWLVLAVGIAWSRRTRRRAGQVAAPTAARLALAIAAGYVAVMGVTGLTGRHAVTAAREVTARRTLVAPVPVTPLRRDVLRDLGDAYEVGVLDVAAGMRYTATARLESGRGAPGVAAAAATDDGRKFLAWSQFPRFRSEPAGRDSLRVRMSDVRFDATPGGSWAGVTVTVAATPPGP